MSLHFASSGFLQQRNLMTKPRSCAVEPAGIARSKMLLGTSRTWGICPSSCSSYKSASPSAAKAPRKAAGSSSATSSDITPPGARRANVFLSCTDMSTFYRLAAPRGYVSLLIIIHT